MMNRQRLQWKFRRFLQQLQGQLDSFKNLWRGSQVSTRMCPACRALVNTQETTCSFCGARLRRRPSGLGKVLQNFLPSYAPVSFILLSANFVLFLLIFAVERNQSVEDLGRLLLGHNFSLVAWGADMGLLVQQGQWWRLISAIFLHSGIIHLGFNSYALIFIGPLLEELLGKERFLVLYLTTGAGGFALSNWYYPPLLPTVGASGAIFGMIGVAIVLSKRWSSWGRALHQQLVHWAIYGFVYGLVLGANNAAHLGGLLSGATLALVLGNPQRATPSKSSQQLWSLLYWLGVVIVVASLYLAIQNRMQS